MNDRLKKLSADKKVVIAGFIILATWACMASIGFILISSQLDSKVAPVALCEPVQEIREPFIDIDMELQSGFLNSEEIMASFYMVEYPVAVESGEDVFKTVYKIEVNRWGFDRASFHEVSTLGAAIVFLRGLK